MAVIATLFVIVHHLILQTADGIMAIYLFTLHQNICDTLLILLWAKACNGDILLHTAFTIILGVGHVGLFPICSPVGYLSGSENILCISPGWLELSLTGSKPKSVLSLFILSSTMLHKLLRGTVLGCWLCRLQDRVFGLSFCWITKLARARAAR